jgi:hypothetical protein
MNIGSLLRENAAHIPMSPRSVLNQAGYAAAAADFEDREKNGGASSAEISAEWAARLEREREEEALKPFVEGPPPEGSTLAGWKLWCDELRDELDTLNVGAERLRKHTGAVEATARTLKEIFAARTNRMLASVGIGTVEPDETAVDPAQLEARLEAERRAAREATAALEIIAEKIAVTEKRLAAVRSRAAEFVNPELCNIAGALGPRYIRAINELREVSSLLFALGVELGAGGRFGSGFEAFERMTFPRPGLATTKTVPDAKFIVGRPTDSDLAYWKNARNTLLANPLAKISLPKAA